MTGRGRMFGGAGFPRTGGSNSRFLSLALANSTAEMYLSSSPCHTHLAEDVLRAGLELAAACVQVVQLCLAAVSQKYKLQRLGFISEGE